MKRFHRIMETLSSHVHISEIQKEKKTPFAILYQLLLSKSDLCLCIILWIPANLRTYNFASLTRISVDVVVGKCHSDRIYPTKLAASQNISHFVRFEQFWDILVLSSSYINEYSLIVVHCSLFVYEHLLSQDSIKWMKIIVLDWLVGCTITH